MNMAKFQFVISDPETRRAYKVEIDQSKTPIIGKKIGDEIDASFLGLEGYVIKITGGTDKDGFPMHPSVPGMGRKKVLLSGPPCFHPRKKGERRRKTVRGNVIGEDIVQINCKIIKKGAKPIEEILGKKEEEKTEQKEESKPEQANK